MSSMQKFNFSRVGRSVLLALSTATALVSLGALAQDTTEPVAQSEEDVERIYVSGRLMSSAASAAAERREQPYVAELLGMEQISRAGDSNAATALRRVTGLTLVKDKFIYVRGLGERYSSTLLNGAMVPSPDPTRNVIPLDMFPAGIIESLVVQKAYSPELPAAFGGGNVNIRTTSIPLQSSFNVSVGVGYNSLNSDDAYDYAGGGDDWRGKDDGSRAISAELAAAQAQYGVLTPINIAEALGGITGPNLAQAETIVRELGTAFNRDIAVSRTSVKPDFDGSLSFGSRFDIAKNVVPNLGEHVMIMTDNMLPADQRRHGRKGLGKSGCLACDRLVLRIGPGLAANGSGGKIAGERTDIASGVDQGVRGAARGIDDDPVCDRQPGGFGKAEARQALRPYGAEVFGSYRVSNGNFPTYENENYTNNLGEIKVGALFSLIAAIGVNRLPDLYTRMHAASKAGTAASASVSVRATGWAALSNVRSCAVSSAKVSAAPRLEARKTITRRSAPSEQAQAAQACAGTPVRARRGWADMTLSRG